MKTDKYISILAEGRRHRFYIDRGTHTMRSKETFPTKARAMHEARKICKTLTFDSRMYALKEDLRTLEKRGIRKPI